VPDEGEDGAGDRAGETSGSSGDPLPFDLGIEEREFGECTGTDATLAALGPKALGLEVTETLRRALALWSGHAQVVRLCTEGEFDPAEAPAGLIDLAIRKGEAPSLKSLEADFKATSKQVRALFKKITS
jgi:glutamate-ammonia-ligase adenylyltransferase